MGCAHKRFARVGDRYSGPLAGPAAFVRSRQAAEGETNAHQGRRGTTQCAPVWFVAGVRHLRRSPHRLPKGFGNRFFRKPAHDGDTAFE
jgi:hypothetical protein